MRVVIATAFYVRVEGKAAAPMPRERAHPAFRSLRSEWGLDAVRADRVERFVATTEAEAATMAAEQCPADMRLKEIVFQPGLASPRLG